MDDGDIEPRPSGSRRTMTMRSNAARQVAVNFMPSRQLAYNTLQRRRTKSEYNGLLEDGGDVEDGPYTAETRANIIVREMEQQDLLMEDNLQAEEMRREALRDLPQGLTMKRNIRAKLSASVSLRSKRRPISMMKRLQYRTSFAFKRMRDRFRNFIFSVELWYEAIRKVEGHFGSAVGSYFYFLRWLFIMNLILTVFMVCFVVIPQALYDNSLNVTERRISDGRHVFLDIISGEGVLEDTIMFYGHYHSSNESSPETMNYNITFSYFYTTLTLYAFAFVVLCYRTAYSYRRTFIGAGAGAGGVAGGGALAARVLCGWDFGVAEPRAAALCARSLYYEFKELLSEREKSVSRRGGCARAGRWARNAAAGALGLGAAGAALGALRAALGAAPAPAAASALVAAAVCGGPLVFALVGRLEDYQPRTALYVNLCRTFVLDIGLLLVLLFFWSGADVLCWETSLGQETYRLVLFDGLLSIFVIPICEFARAYLYKMHFMNSPPEFNIAYNSLTLIYNQAVLWLGMLFSPLLVVAVTLKFLLLFYVKKETALRACQPASKVWRAAQTQTVLYMFVNLSLFITLFVVGSIFFSASPACGPLAGLAGGAGGALGAALGLAARPGLRAALAFALRPGVVAFLLLALGVSVYYMRAKSLAQQSMVEILRQMLVLEAKDKEFLLSAIDKVSNGEWLYSPKADKGNDSHTWKYLNDANVRKPSNSGFHLSGPRPGPAPPRPAASGEDGDSDSSFSWRGPAPSRPAHADGGEWL